MSILADWFRSVFPAKRAPQDTQWPRPLPPSAALVDIVRAGMENERRCIFERPADGLKVVMKEDARYRGVPVLDFLAKHGLSLDSKLSDAVCGESEFHKHKRAVAAKNFTKTPEQRKADHAKSVATKALKKARTAELRAALQRSVELGK